MCTMTLPFWEHLRDINEESLKVLPFARGGLSKTKEQTAQMILVRTTDEAELGYSYVLNA